MCPTNNHSRRLVTFSAAAMLLFTLNGTAAKAVRFSDFPQMRKLGRAALTLQSDRAYDFSGQVVRCDATDGVGIMAESRGALSVTNVTIEGCTVGIVTTGPSVRLEGVTVRNTTGVCMMLSGADSIALSNVATGCTYGMVVMSNGNRIAGNSFNENTVDGILVTGDANLLEDNEAVRNGGVGIHVVRMVPMIGDDQFVPLLQDLATGNVVRRNRALDNNVDLEEFGRCDDPGLFNEWVDNVFRTGRPECVH